ncbi:beta-galactosidase [Litorihabitans aurantiacus]|uniref:beta-galactosidase n=1 Tax=Litorihabitans aurantiacus TaxID=1930061 RepID=A0AA37XHG3_9MICO|nr:beta-galactosidase [Litorihabitans aurantiacus]GMA33360.1 beta-galactosidase [Litorihabitans aurantiacus]
MVAAGFTVIRVGESVWSTWEPEPGRFDLEWLAPVLDAAHERGIRVVLGTPTYAAPMWLARLYPEINVRRSNGEQMGWGHRQEIDYSHPGFLLHAERIIRAIAARYADHPAVVGFQVDNEPGNEIFHNPQVFQRFVDHLRHRYGTVEELNEQWGLTYWSHRLSTWADLWTPHGNAQPQYALAWRRFQASLTTDFIGWQADVVREYARDDQFVTTCIAYERPAVEDEAMTRRLDVTSGNAYYRMQDHLALPAATEGSQAWMTGGTWALFQSADRMYGSKQAPFLVTETNATAIAHQWVHETAYDGQWRQAAWALVARGAAMIEYWHWHTLPYGAETYWGGVLPHSLEPGRVYEQIAQLGGELRTAGTAVTGLVPDAPVGLVFSDPTKWALADFPQLATPDGEGDPRTFQRIADAFYRGAFDAGLGVRVLHPEQLVEREPADVVASQPVLVAAGLTILDDAQLDWLRRYAQAGGHLVLGIRTGYEDEEARARPDRKPSHLHEAAGVWYDEFSSLTQPLEVVGSDALPLGPGAHATAWVDGLQTTGAQVLATYRHPHFGRWPAVTTHTSGAGRVTYVGTVPDAELGRAVLAWAAQTSGVDAGWRPQAETQTSHGARNAAGEQLRFVHNWSWDASTFTLPVEVVDLLGGETLAAGSVLELGAWDVRVLREVR